MKIRLLVLALITTSFVAAQTTPDLDNGMKAYGSFHGGSLDSVGLANGNLNLHIPLISYPQRGKLGMDFYIGYHSKQWHIETFDGGTNIQHWVYGNPTDNLAPGINILLAQGYTTSGATALFDRGDGTNMEVDTISIVGSDGTTHQIGTSGTSCDGRALDATGLMCYSTTNGQGQINGQYVVDTAGNTYGWNNMLDANGNSITASSGGWTDTMGRFIPTYLGNTGADTSGCPSNATQAKLWSPPGFNGGTYHIKFCYATYYLATNFNEYGEHGAIVEGNVNTLLIVAAVLPNGTNWTFDYNSYGDLTTLTFPTGGTITYGWTSGYVPAGNGMSRIVTSRTLNANDGTGSHTWNYACCGSTVTVTDPASNDTVHTIDSSGYETQTQYYQGPSTNSANLLKTIQTAFHEEPSPWTIYGFGSAVNVVPISTTTIWPGGLTSKVNTPINYYDSGTPWTFYNAYSYSYQQYTLLYGKLLQQDEYDYGQGAPGALLRTTYTHYKWQDDANYLNANMLDLVASNKINGSFCPVAGLGWCSYTEYQYDQLTPQPSGISTQHTTPSTAYRGNLDYVQRHFDNNSCLTYSNPHCAVSKTLPYDTGMPYQSTDPDGNPPTTYSYSSTYAGAYITQTQMPDTGSPPVHHIVSGTYDFNTGLLTSFTDQNSNVSSYAYDSMLRMTSASFPDGGSTTFNYNGDPVPPKVTKTVLATPSPSIVSSVQMDGFARATRTSLDSDPQGVVYTDTTYDGLGRVYTVSNPYRTGDTIYSTATNYDALGRTTQITKQDGSSESDQYAGNFHTHYDEKGNFRGFRSDALGRLGFVYEENANTYAWAYSTYYSYDALNNLLSVNQQGDGTGTARNRNFAYDSLSRLLTSANPESGQNTYTYDNDGNVATKTDARGILTTYTYDALNRLTTKTYSDGTITSKYAYDEYAGNIGRMTSLGTWTSNGWTTGSNYQYDPMGRLKWQHDYCRPFSYSCAYDTTATYNLAGGMASLTYPSGRLVTNIHDAVGRVNQVWFANFGATQVNYPYWTANNINPSGNVYLATLGNGALEYSQLNSRLQPCQFALKMGSTWLADRRNRYGNATTDCANSSVTGNNGNVMSVVDNVNPAKTQTYAYDYLNRITSAASSATSGPDQWSQTFTYDPWGNMNQHGSKAFEYPFASNNRIVYYNYDAAGNVLNDGTHGLAYDAEGQITGIDSGATTYTYDANGERVRKLCGTGAPACGAAGNFTEYVYFSGEPIAEKDQSGAWTDYIFAGGKRVAMATGTTSSGTTYYHGDHLGSQRLMTDSNGAVVAGTDRTYLPFGWEWNGPGSSTNHYKFTGKERDAETQNDYFGARYYNSSMGRWLSPDPVTMSRDLSDPQTLNRYSYVFNRPTMLIDPDGRWPTAIHNLIIETVFKNILNSDDIQNLKIASAEVDGDQSPSGAYKHAMRSPFELGAGGIARAEQDSELWIASNLDNAVSEQIKYENASQDAPDRSANPLVYAPYSSTAIHYFGLALHTVTDSASPWHRGTQMWPGVDSLDHIANENRTASVRTRYDSEIQWAEYEARLLWTRFQIQLQRARQENLSNRKSGGCAMVGPC